MAPTKNTKRLAPDALTKDVSSSKRRNLTQSLNLSQAAYSYIRCGKILRMHLTNFMCHSNLIIDFNNRINFLVGSNGSGKSAVLAALVLGLGAKASSTNRSQNMKHFIKTDQTSANIEIEISNAGSDAFNFESYGDKIVVVRHITHSSSQYRIKNSHGEVVSRKADDLHRILLYHNIQVDNPVFVLNQDSARVFLKDLDPMKNYQLFIKATQIEIVAEKLNDCLHASKEQKFQVICFEKRIAQIREELEGLQQRLAQLQSVDKVKKLLNSCELERLWIFVIAQERHLQAINISIEELITQKVEFDDLMRNKDIVEGESRQAIRDCEENLEAKRTSFIEENLKYNSLKSKFIEMNDRCSEIECNIESQKKGHTLLEQQISKLQEYIAEKVSNNRVSVQDLRAKNDAELSSIKKRCEEVTAMLEAAKREIHMLVSNKGQFDQKIDDLKRNQHRLQEETQRIQSQIHNIKANSKDALSIYGEDVSLIVSRIDKLYQERKFTERPRGPLGRYIEVIDTKFRDAVENQLGSLINSFVVCNNKDYKVLQSVLKNYPNCNPTVITMKFMSKAYDVSRGKVHPPRGTYLLMDQIRCADHVVLNCLIDRGHIETILLTESKEVAEHFTSNIENVPQNLSKIIVIKPGLEYCPDPAYRMYSLKIRPAMYIQADIRQRIKQMEQEMNIRKAEIEQCEAKLQEIRPQLQNTQKSIQNNRSIGEKHENSKRDLDERIKELESYEYPDHNEMDVLANELEVYKTKLAQVQKQIEEKLKSYSDAKIARRATQEELTEQKVTLKQIDDEMNQIKAQSDEAQVKLNSLINSVRANETKLQEINANIERFEEDKAAKLRELAELHSQAEKAGPRIDSQRSETEIDEVIRQLKSKVKHRTQSNENIADVQQLIEGKSQTLTKYETLCSSVTESLEMLNESRVKRFRFLKNLKRHMAMKVVFTFQNILSNRQFTGNISIDHDERKLTISVVPRDHSVERSISSTKSLSGGERSFSTVAFLLSLWSCVDHPFYFLDEYDVFTDEVNRDVMTRMLLAEAEAKPHRQYTFLTPQDMALESKEYIRIHRMADPRR